MVFVYVGAAPHTSTPYLLIGAATTAKGLPFRVHQADPEGVLGPGVGGEVHGHRGGQVVHFIHGPPGVADLDLGTEREGSVGTEAQELLAPGGTSTLVCPKSLGRRVERTFMRSCAVEWGWH